MTMNGNDQLDPEEVELAEAEPPSRITMLDYAQAELKVLASQPGAIELMAFHLKYSGFLGHRVLGRLYVRALRGTRPNDRLSKRRKNEHNTGNS